MKVKILEDDDRLGIKAGEVYDARSYWLDPREKVSLIGRVPDGYDPCCNQYRDSVAHWINGRWHEIRGNEYVPMAEQEQEQ